MGGNVFSIEVKVKADPGESEIISGGLREYNDKFVEEDHHQELVVVLRDAQGALAGGLLGGTYWRWLHIDILWVREDVRSLGYGNMLMGAAEQEAIRRGCRHSHLETHDFQALGFYQKNGYGLFAQLEDLPPEHIKYFLKKDL